MHQLEIDVTGTGTAIRPAERALISLAVTPPHVESPAAASAVVTETVNGLREVISPLCPQDQETGRTSVDAAIVNWSMSTMTTREHSHPRTYIPEDKKYIVNKTDPLFSAHATFTIKFQDFATLGTVATQLSVMDNIRISKITWLLTDETLEELKGAARKDTGIDAIQNLRDHAEVFAGVIGEDEFKKRVRPVPSARNDIMGKTQGRGDGWSLIQWTVLHRRDRRSSPKTSN